MNDVIQYFRVRMLLLSRMSLRFTHIIAFISSSFLFIAELYFSVCMYRFPLLSESIVFLRKLLQAKMIPRKRQKEK